MKMVRVRVHILYMANTINQSSDMRTDLCLVRPYV